MQSIGVIGLGLIGAALVRRLIHCAITPVVFDLKTNRVQEASSTGAIAAQSSRELAQRCDLILLCVQTDQQCVSAVTAADGIVSGARPGTCVAVLSTVQPATIHSLAEQAAAHGVTVVDTPVAGRGMFSVEEGSMTAMVGDDGDLYARLEPTLRLFASRIVPAGPLGSGAALKLAHNIVVYAGFAAMIEAVDLAKAAGVKSGLVEEVTEASGALSRLSAFYIPFYQHQKELPPGVNESAAFRVAAALVDKDLSDAIALASVHGIELPVAQVLSHAGARIFPVTE